ncbi:gliding motility-associated C-terminal domain-containing protein [Plebeiibacterium marinum]|uniref:Gliding motility-associated C-terminal domain-containing protein n=1 Tax=Plebeiibacterium marinum TaxID=2992111 RepID=A0AAE3MA73_9BACT|nr:gliding motility-associated C-terminal domain-containing protein [Plebeiobacterium marinum]MCW3804168.1 gliding motility-associated C-terminal domain-containing protein [Plebeiobacterium marinum]
MKFIRILYAVILLVINSYGYCNREISYDVKELKLLSKADAGEDAEVCGLVYNLQAELDGGSGFWELYSGPGQVEYFSNIEDPNATVQVNQYGTYVFQWTEILGESQSIDRVEVAFRDHPVAFAGEDMILEYIFSTKLNATEILANEIGIWELVSGDGSILNPDMAHTEINSLSLGNNVFRWTVSNGVCPSSEDYIVIKVNNLVIPSLITPNYDGKNDVFLLRGIETLGKTELLVFDKRGMIVYENPNYDNQWNGVDQKGNQLPDDTYYYRIKSSDGKTISGFVVVRR